MDTRIYRPSPLLWGLDSSPVSRHSWRHLTLNIGTIQSINPGISPSQNRVFKVLLPLLMQLEAHLVQHVLAADKLLICVCLRILVSLVLAAGEVSKKQRHEGAKGFSRVALAPVGGIEHVAYFWSSYRADEANDAWGGIRGGMEELNGEVPIDRAVEATLDPS